LQKATLESEQITRERCGPLREAIMDTPPISIKGVLIEDGKVVLLENERGEWELPGGRPERGEQPSIRLMREFAEELGTEIEVGPIIDCWNFEVLPNRYVMIVTYTVARAHRGELRISDEHRRASVMSIVVSAGSPWTRLMDYLCLTVIGVQSAAQSRPDSFVNDAEWILAHQS
jgi:ADP-ribose pyrophosphatase YjhB (NUDIX family)